MTYKILQQISTTTTEYFQFIQVNGADYSTTDLVVLEAKLLELLETIPKSKLKIISEHSFSDDLIITA